MPVPEFFAFASSQELSRVARRVKFPCVVKPLTLSASQGVIRANNAEEFEKVVERIRLLVTSPEIQILREPALDQLLVEKYIPGKEVTVEGLVTNGLLRVLAIFDKPDQLEGPFFEETIYVTPSRLAEAEQKAVEDCAQLAVRALGLTTGPIHAEFRVNEEGPWVLEIAPRPIGGLCSLALRFGPEKMPLEELLLRHALGMEGSELPREEAATGVIMIPVPRSGIFDGVEGIEEAEKIAGIDEIRITARLHDYVAAWPEGASYLGFIFAHGQTPAEAEATLRAAHDAFVHALAEFAFPGNAVEARHLTPEFHALHHTDILTGGRSRNRRGLRVGTFFVGHECLPEENRCPAKILQPGKEFQRSGCETAWAQMASDRNVIASC